METALFDYELPADLIAQEPLARREGSRLLLADGCLSTLQNERFENLPQIFERLFPDKKPLVVVNRSRVYPARVRIRRQSGARGEVFLLETGERPSYACLLRPQKKVRVGEVLFADTDEGELQPLFRVESIEPPRVSPLILPLQGLLDGFGEMPLPPYIVRDPKRVGRGFASLDRERYQTVYSAELGSAAATTAGLHFTPDVMAACEGLGCRFCSVILHVGLGTFQPVQSERIDDHPMHSETFSVPVATAQALAGAIASGTPIVFVGTTSLRAVESFLRAAFPELEPHALRGSLASFPDLSKRLETLAEQWLSTALFLRPRGHEDRVLPAVGQAIITNFHGPSTTLTMLVAALMGYDFWKKMYNHAIDNRYRFLSYGDSSLLVFSHEP